jgi:lipopolysaccharide export system protein LptA
MKFPSIVWLLLSALVPPVAHAEKADRNQPMNVEADALRYDDQKQISVFTGSVVLTKGTILIRGGRIEVRKDPQGYQQGLVTAEPGKLAFFRQKREGVDEHIEGESETIDYDARTDTVKFVSKAQLRRYQGVTVNDEFRANVIVYNNASDVFTLDGTPATSANASAGRAGSPAGRVRAMLTPKTDATPPADSASTLRNTPQLGGSIQ